MLPNHLTKQYLLNSLIYFVLSVLFSISLSWFFLNHLDIEFSLTESILTSVAVTLGLILLWTFKKLSVVLILVTLSLRLLYVVVSQDLSIAETFDPLLRLYQEFEASIVWMLLPPGSKPLLPTDLSMHVSAIASVIGFFVLWLRPLPLAALIILVVPLFFYLGLSDIKDWIGWLFLGLLPIIISMTFITNMKGSRKTHYQLPPLGVIISVLALTLMAYLFITPEQIYSPRANHWILENFGGGARSQVSPFTLSDVGYNNTLGGPVSLSNRPFMEVAGPNVSFYLRASVYDEFQGNSWAKSSTTLHELTDQTETTMSHFRSVFNLNGIAQSYIPQVSIIPRNDEINVLFHGGRPTAFHFPNTHFSDPSNEGVPEYEIYFNEVGDVFLNRPLTPAGYDVETILYGEFEPIVEVYRYHEVDIPRGERSTTYEQITRDTHPELWELVYNQAEEMPAVDRVHAIRNYFRDNFTYTLEVDYLDPGVDVVEDLLLTQEGYCTYYGTALALLLRDAGFITRYAEGFVVPRDANDPNNIHPERLISENQAHAWTEIYLDGIGYYPIDATPAGYYEDLTTIPEALPPETDEVESGEPENPLEDRPEILDEGQDVDLGVEPLQREGFAQGLREYWWLILPAYFLWRILVWFLRHNKQYLHLRYKPKALVKKVWPDLLHLYELQGIKLNNEDTLRTSLNRVLDENSYWSYWNDREEREGILTMLEEVHFSNHDNDFKHLDEFLDYYASVENKTYRKMNKDLWFIQRFLWSRRHPL